MPPGACSPRTARASSTRCPPSASHPHHRGRPGRALPRALPLHGGQDPRRAPRGDRGGRALVQSRPARGLRPRARRLPRLAPAGARVTAATGAPTASSRWTPRGPLRPPRHAQPAREAQRAQQRAARASSSTPSARADRDEAVRVSASCVAPGPASPRATTSAPTSLWAGPIRRRRATGRWPRHVVHGWFEIWDLAKPVIAQVHGYCLAGGSELASACDLVYVAEDAQIGYPPVRLMSPPDTQFHPWLVGMRRAMELMLTGDPISGAEAARIGFANRAFPAADLDGARARDRGAGRQDPHLAAADQQAVRPPGDGDHGHARGHPRGHRAAGAGLSPAGIGGVPEGSASAISRTR